MSKSFGYVTVQRAGNTVNENRMRCHFDNWKEYEAFITELKCHHKLSQYEIVDAFWGYSLHDKESAIELLDFIR